MSRREQVRKLRLQVGRMLGNPVATAIGRIMDELSVNYGQLETCMTKAELNALDPAVTRELLELLEGRPYVA